jgi:hypothetical protein
MTFSAVVVRMGLLRQSGRGQASSFPENMKVLLLLSSLEAAA